VAVVDAAAVAALVPVLTTVATDAKPAHARREQDMWLLQHLARHFGTSAQTAATEGLPVDACVSHPLVSDGG
jgi:hypothetical protein